MELRGAGVRLAGVVGAQQGQSRVVAGQVPASSPPPAEPDPIVDEDKEDGDDSGRGRDEDEKGEVVHICT